MNKPKAVKGLPAVLFYLVQLTWGLPVNIIGFLVFLVCKLRKCPTEKYCNSFITYVKKKNFGGLSMGLFIFIRDEKEKKFGFTTLKFMNTDIQFRHLFWVCLLDYCRHPVGDMVQLICRLQKKNNVSYYKLYCESWANNWGQKWVAKNKSRQD